MVILRTKNSMVVEWLRLNYINDERKLDSKKFDHVDRECIYDMNLKFLHT